MTTDINRQEIRLIIMIIDNHKEIMTETLTSTTMIIDIDLTETEIILTMTHVCLTEGIIIPIHKQGNSSDPNNYRGITLNSYLGKLFCHVLNERISKYLLDKSFIGGEQAGFRKNHRTSDQFLF